MPVSAYVQSAIFLILGAVLKYATVVFVPLLLVMRRWRAPESLLLPIREALAKSVRRKVSQM